MQSANPRRWSALAVIALAQFMVIMDTSIIGVALPEIQSDLGFSSGDLSWVFNAYVVALAGLLLLGGRLSDLVGAKRVFTAGWIVLAGRLAARRSCRFDRPRDRRTRGPGRGRRADRALRADAADDALRRQSEGADEGVCNLRRRGPRRRHGRRVSRRRDHGVGLVAVGVLHQHPDRAGRARSHAGPDARGTGAPRLDRLRRRDHRHRRARAHGVRRRACTRGGLGLGGDAADDRRRPRSARGLPRDPGQPLESR